jgi:hypothetical protein
MEPPSRSDNGSGDDGYFGAMTITDNIDHLFVKCMMSIGYYRSILSKSKQLMTVVLGIYGIVRCHCFINLRVKVEGCQET